jgi:hypothetical protein
LTEIYVFIIYVPGPIISPRTRMWSVADFLPRLLFGLVFCLFFARNLKRRTDLRGQSRLQRQHLTVFEREEFTATAISCTSLGPDESAAVGAPLEAQEGAPLARSLSDVGARAAAPQHGTAQLISATIKRLRQLAHSEEPTLLGWQIPTGATVDTVALLGMLWHLWDLQESIASEYNNEGSP